MAVNPSIPKLVLDQADLERFRLAIRTADPVEFARRRAMLRERQALKAKELSEAAAEKAKQGVQHTFANAEGVLKQNIPHPSAKESEGDGDHSSSEEDALASRPRSLVRSSKGDVMPVYSRATEASSHLEGWGARKERAGKYSPSRESLFISQDPASEQAPAPAPAQALSSPSHTSEGVHLTTAGHPNLKRSSISAGMDTDISSMKIPKKGAGSSSLLAQQVNVSDNQVPKWYQKLKRANTRTKNNPLEASADALLRRLTDYIKDASASLGRTSQAMAFENVRRTLHTIAFTPITPQLLRNTKMFSIDGLHQITGPSQSGGVAWPYDIKADARELFAKWYREDFDTDLMRGIKFTGKHEKGGDSIDLSFGPKVDAKYYGAGDLVNGQWWPIQLCALRDGAHGSSQGGIAGHRELGAYSVILSGGVDPEGKPYPDEDHGDWLWYCGTDSINGVSTATSYLLKNQTSQRSVRLLRSQRANSSWAPKVGFRYDGLYKVKNSRVLDRSKNRHQFFLERVCSPIFTSRLIIHFLSSFPIRTLSVEEMDQRRGRLSKSRKPTLCTSVLSAGIDGARGKQCYRRIRSGFCMVSRRASGEVFFTMRTTATRSSS